MSIARPARIPTRSPASGRASPLSVFDPNTSGNYESYNTDLWRALERLEGQDAGTSPEGALSSGYDQRWNCTGPVRCNTFDKQIEAVDKTYSYLGNKIGADILEEYVQRLHGSTVEDDLKLAGLLPVTPWKKGESYNVYSHGLGFNGTGSTKDREYKADIIAYGSGQIHKQQTTFAKYKDFSVFDDDVQHFEMDYLTFHFKE